ncbi:hypothetical protein [Vagococcus elongatus]
METKNYCYNKGSSWESIEAKNDGRLLNECVKKQQDFFIEGALGLFRIKS